MWDFVEDLELDSRFPGIGGRRLKEVEREIQYIKSLHYAIVHLCQVDRLRALPAHSSGRRELDLLDIDNSARCFCRWC